MPTPAPLEKVLIIGAGPVRIGQPAAIDIAACRACEELKTAGLQTVMIHCDPSALASDAKTADTTYLMPLTEQAIATVIDREKPDGLLPTVGGPTAMSLTKTLVQSGLLERTGVRLLGVRDETLALIDDPAAFHDAVSRLGLATPQRQFADQVSDAAAAAEKMGYPVFVRTSGPSDPQRYGIVYNVEELRSRLTGRRLAPAAIRAFCIEQALTGYREIEVVVLRDAANRMMIVALAENVDPVGIHSGDSTTVIPAATIGPQTRLAIEQAAFQIAEHAGVSGSVHLKFAVAPDSKMVLVLAVNPMVSALTALCDSAFGTCLASIHARLALGVDLDEATQGNALVQTRAAADERVVVRLPCWEFERFPGETVKLDARLKSTGAVFGIGSNFLEALHHAARARSPETATVGPPPDLLPPSRDELMRTLVPAAPNRLSTMLAALKSGAGTDAVAGVTGIHIDWIRQLATLATLEAQLAAASPDPRSPALLEAAVEAGFSAAGIARCSGVSEAAASRRLSEAGIQIRPVAAGDSDRAPWSFGAPSGAVRPVEPLGNSILIVGPAFGRIGQNIEMDHGCVHGARALQAAGRKVLALNANPASAMGTDAVDRTYAAPVTAAAIKAICRFERPEGVILQFGGYRAMRLAQELLDDGIAVLGTATDDMARSQARSRFGALLTDLGIPHPHSGKAHSPEQALDLAESVGYPLVAIPQADRHRKKRTLIMDARMMEHYVMHTAISPVSPIILEQFLEYAIEVEADALCDGRMVYVPAAMEHIELAGVHSGDAAIVVPPYSTPPRHIETIGTYIQKIALELNIKGMLNTRFAVYNDTVYLLEARPWACRTLPMVSTLCHVPMAERAVEIMLGMSLEAMDLPRRLLPHYGIRASVFPFDTFTDTDPLLGPRMRSTGQAMVLANVFGMAYFNSQEAAGAALPLQGTVLITVTDADKPSILEPARLFQEMGFRIQATRGTHAFLKQNGIAAQLVKKLGFGRPDLVDGIITGEVALVVNTPSGRQSQQDDAHIRKTAIRYRIPNITTPAGALAAAKGIAARKQGHESLCALQAYVRALR